MKVDKEITEDEAALYDRQIRLWGVDAQKKLLSARILLINMQGLGAEIAKNLVLSGINKLTILDSNNVQEEDLKFNFLINANSVGQNRAESCVDALQILNPLVKITSEKEPISSKDEAYFSNFDLVCALSSDFGELECINKHCRANKVLFLCGYVYGLYAYTFLDFDNYQYLVEMPKISDENDEKKGKTCSVPSSTTKGSEKLELEEKTIKFKSFGEFFADYQKPTENLSANKLKRLSKSYFIFWMMKKYFDTHNKSFSNASASSEERDQLFKIKKSLFEECKFNEEELLSDSYLSEKNFNEFTPVNAILGGVIAQEIIKAISKKNEPINNFFLFDGNSMSGDVITI